MTVLTAFMIPESIATETATVIEFTVYTSRALTQAKDLTALALKVRIEGLGVDSGKEYDGTARAQSGTTLGVFYITTDAVSHTIAGIAKVQVYVDSELANPEWNLNISTKITVA